MSLDSPTAGADAPRGDQSSPTGRSSVQIGRFRLDDQILGDSTGGLWRAFDELLKRTVSLRLVPSSNPDQDALRTAACAAARVVDPHVARVLDVLDHDSTLVIVTEWAEGIPLEQLIDGTMSAAQALQITQQVANALCNIHAAGTTHGRIRPGSVLIDNEGQVRLRGHTIDAKIWGISPGNDPVAADISGLGAILSACLTGRWSGDTPSLLPKAAVVGGKRALPSQLRADLPSDLDDFVVRAMAAAPGPQIRASTHPFPTVVAAREGLATLTSGRSMPSSSADLVVPGFGASKHTSGGTIFKRAFGVALVASVLIATGFAGARLILPANPATQAAIAPASASPSASPSQTPPIKAGQAIPDAVTTNSAGPATNGQFALAPPVPAVTGEVVLPVYDIQTLRGQGQGLTTTDFPGFAVDSDPATAWYTENYRTTKRSLKSAPGIVLDLGAPRAVQALNLALIGNNTNIVIKTSNTLGTDQADYEKMATVTGAPPLTTVRIPKPVTARYVLVLLTQVPWSAGGYRGGISTVHIHGN